MRKVKVDSCDATFYSWGLIIAGALISVLSLLSPSHSLEGLIVGVPLLLFGVINLTRLEGARAKRPRTTYPSPKRESSKVQIGMTRGLREFENKNYSRAIDAFKEVLKDGYLTGRVEMEVLGLISRCYLLNQNWNEALQYTDRTFTLGQTINLPPSYDDHLVRIESALKVANIKKAYSTLILAKERFGSKQEIKRVENLLKPFLKDIEGEIPIVCPKCGLSYQGDIPPFCFACNEVLPSSNKTSF